MRIGEKGLDEKNLGLFSFIFGGDTDVMKRRGRPRVGAGKDGRLEVRVSDTDAAKLAYISEKTGKTKTDIVIEGIRARYNLELFKGN